MQLYFAPHDIAYQLLADPDDMRDVLASMAETFEGPVDLMGYATRVATGSGAAASERAIAGLLRQIADALDAVHADAP